MNLIKKILPNRYMIVKHLPLLAKLIYFFHRGICIDCVDCCIKHHGPCKHLDLKAKRCKIYESRPLTCQVAPFPQDLWWDKRYKKCKIWYPLLTKKNV